MRAATLLLSLLLAPALHAADNPALLGDSDCRVVNLFPAQANRAEWSGPCKDGFAHGRGVLLWELKQLHYSKVFVARYEGDVERGLPNGSGRKTFWETSVYEGGFRNGRFDGIGTMRDADGRYEGEWKDGMREGRGKMVFHVGGSYEGEWKSNSYHGKGVVTFPGGRKLNAVIDDMPAFAGHGDELAAPYYLLRFGGAVPVDPGAARQNYGLDFGRPLVGEEAKSEEVKGSNVPYRKAYDELSAEQKQLVRAHYPLMDDADEPPYPQHGSQGIMEKVRREQGARFARGTAIIYVTVNPDGTAKSALVARTPKQALTDDIKAILMNTRYKPGMCGGTPCEMVYPFLMHFSVKM
jgi:hypothetical protein